MVDFFFFFQKKNQKAHLQLSFIRNMLFCTADSIQERQHFSSLIEYSNVSRAPTVCVCVCLCAVLYITLTLYFCVTCKVKVLLTDALKMLCHASLSMCILYLTTPLRLSDSLLTESYFHHSAPSLLFFSFFSFSVLLVHFYVIYESNA